MKTNKWTDGPFLNIGRKYLSCGILRWKIPESGKLIKIVVAAGGKNQGSDLSSVELLYLNDDDTNNGGWVMGPELPQTIYSSTMVEYNNSVILIGGRYDGSYNRHLYKLSSPNGTWSEMKQVLKTPRAFHVSFLVPDEIVNCKEKKLNQTNLN